MPSADVIADVYADVDAAVQVDGLPPVAPSQLPPFYSWGCVGKSVRPIPGRSIPLPWAITYNCTLPSGSEMIHVLLDILNFATPRYSSTLRSEMTA